MNDIKYSKIVATISTIVEKYKNRDFFTNEMTQSVNESLNEKELKIAIIGKMKAGKSSFTNALIFQNKVLPSGTEPTTVTLTEIAYTDDPAKDSRVVVELLSKKDIDDLRDSANSDNGKISENAKDLLHNLDRMKEGYEQYISKGIVEISIDDLKKFTAQDGELSGLAKKVTIYKNLDVLKGIKIIDTPGFNDPVISRVEATKKALKECHIILFIHDYLDKYDQDEMDILCEQVEYSTAVRLVDIINRVDASENPLNEWPSYISECYKKKKEVIKNLPEGKESIKELLEEGKVSYTSALMALIGYEILDSKKNNTEISDDTKEFYIDYTDHFEELKSADDFIKYSNIAGIVDLINQLSADKSKDLEKYPINNLLGYLKTITERINIKINEETNQLTILNTSAIEAEQQLESINQLMEQLGQKINSPTLATKLRESINDTKHDIQEQRTTRSNNEFTKSNYEKEGSIFSSAPERRNLSRYKGFLIDFDDIIRNKLEELKKTFENTCDAYINEIIEGLITNDITEKHREYFKKELINLLNSEISKGIIIEVNPDEPTAYLYGDGEQFASYKSDFWKRRSDTVIENNYLKIFRTFVENIICSETLRSNISDAIEELKSTLKRTLQYSPTEKKKEIRKHEEEKERLQKDLEEIKKDIESLNNLKQKA